MNYFPRKNGFQQRSGNGQKRDMGGKAWLQTQSQHPKAPQFTGVVTILGVDYRVSVWIEHDPQKGDTLSFKFQDKQEQRAQSFQQSGGYSGYAPQPPANGGQRHAPFTPGGGYRGHPPQPIAGNGQPHNSYGHGQPQGQNFASNRTADAPWPNDGAPMPSPEDYGSSDPWEG